MRAALRIVVLAACLAASGGAAAQSVTKVIVPAPAGGGTDAFFRVVGKEAEAVLKGPVIVANVAGAGGTIGVAQMVSAKPDGLTLAGIWSSPLTASPHAMKTPYTPNDYLPVIALSQSPYVFCVAADFPAKDGPALVEALRRSPDKYTYGNDGIGGTGQLAAQRIFRALGVRVRDVPFKGAGETLNNFLGGHVDLYVGSISPVLPWVKAGKARCLMLTSAERTPVFPEASGLKDLGIGGEETLLWRAVLAPKGTPADTVKRIEEAFEAAMRTPAAKKFCEEAGEDIVIRRGADLRRMLDAEYTALGAVAKSLNLSP
jgi:tripartite-type tricarboxylate transporter receptor subunit TctC